MRTPLVMRYPTMIERTENQKRREKNDIEKGEG